MISPGVLKLLHLLGVVLMLGNVIVTGLWSLRAVRTRDLQVVAFAQREVLWTDLVLTLGGGSLLTMSGIFLGWQRGYPFWETPWLRTGIGLLALSTTLWVAVLLPCQVLLARMARQSLRAGRLAPAFTGVYVLWSVVGWLGTGLLLGALGLMVLKPAL